MIIFGSSGQTHSRTLPGLAKFSVIDPLLALPQVSGFTMSCHHMSDLTPVPPRTPQGCEECLQMGSSWVHLRLCLSCGHVGCCDSSPNRHATGHFRETTHPVMASFERGERWAWCYLDQAELAVPKRVEPFLRG